MKFQIFSLLVLLCITISSCGSEDNPEGRADAMCNCAKDAGVDFSGISSERDLNRLMGEFGDLPEKDMQKAGKCVLEVMKGIQKDVKDMNDSEKSKYIRELAKATIDTDCVVDGMEEFKYDEFEKMLDLGVRQMEKELD